MIASPQTPSPDARARHTIAFELAKYLDSQTGHRVSLRNLLLGAAGQATLGEVERAVQRDAELLRGERLLGIMLPWSALASRSMTLASGQAGGFASGVAALPLHDLLRADSVVAAAGAVVYDGLQVSDATIPCLTAEPTTYWTAEGVQHADSDAGLSQGSLSQRTVLTRTKISEQLLRQSTAEEQLRTIFRRALAAALDRAAISGPGGAQALGILNHNIGSASGTSLSYSTICQQIEALMLAGARKADLFMLAGATAARILSTRERATGSGFIFDGGQIADVRCTATAHLPASTLLIGVASQVAVGVWGQGIEVQSNRSAGFNIASVDLRGMLTADAAVMNPAAFVKFATVT